MHVELDPDILARILEHDHTHPGRYSYIISQVQRYSPDLGAFVAKSAYRHICQLSSPLYQSRAHYATETEQVSSTLEYIMMLLEGSKTTTASNSYENAESPESQTVYVALHVVRASLLILLHRCTVENPTQRGLLDLYSCDETADAYTSEKGFSTVRYARDKARLAVESFEGGGGRLGGQTAYLILGRT